MNHRTISKAAVVIFAAGLAIAAPKAFSQAANRAKAAVEQQAMTPDSARAAANRVLGGRGLKCKAGKFETSFAFPGIVDEYEVKDAKGERLTFYYEEDFRAMVAGKALARGTGNYVAYLDDKTKTVFIFVKDIVEDAPAPLQ